MCKLDTAVVVPEKGMASEVIAHLCAVGRAAEQDVTRTLVGARCRPLEGRGAGRRQMAQHTSTLGGGGGAGLDGWRPLDELTSAADASGIDPSSRLDQQLAPRDYRDGGGGCGGCSHRRHRCRRYNQIRGRRRRRHLESRWYCARPSAAAALIQLQAAECLRCRLVLLLLSIGARTGGQ